MIRRLPLPLSAALLVATALAVWAALSWPPIKRIRDGRHDLGRNAIWVGHGWLGDDEWFERYEVDPDTYRAEWRAPALAERLSAHGVAYVYPHLCPSEPNGTIAAVDHDSTEYFLDCMSEFKVIPWVGGVLDEHCFPADAAWRRTFIDSIADLLKQHPRMAGIQLNIEPLPNGNRGFLQLLEELRARIPSEKIISVAAYPPPTKWHPFPDIHWDEAYHREVAARTDQVASMMYDTALRSPRKYDRLMTKWTREVVGWSEGAEVLLGVPVYSDEGVGYHHPHAENIQYALSGIHCGLNTFESLPTNYSGVALYSEWEMDETEWDYLKNEFCRP